MTSEYPQVGVQSSSCKTFSSLEKRKRHSHFMSLSKKSKCLHWQWFVQIKSVTFTLQIEMWKDNTHHRKLTLIFIFAVILYMMCVKHSAQTPLVPHIVVWMLMSRLLLSHSRGSWQFGGFLLLF